MVQEEADTGDGPPRFPAVPCPLSFQECSQGQANTAVVDAVKMVSGLANPFWVWRGYVKEMVQSDQEMEQRRCRLGRSQTAVQVVEWRLGFEKKRQSIVKPTRTDLGPVQRRGFGGGLALAPRALTTAGQVSRWPGWTGAWAQPCWRECGRQRSRRGRRIAGTDRGVLRIACDLVWPFCLVNVGSR